MQIIHRQEKYVLMFEWLVPFNFCIWSQVICWKISQALILMLCKYISSLKQLARVAPTFPNTSCQDFLLHESFCSVFFSCIFFFRMSPYFLSHLNLCTFPWVYQGRTLHPWMCCLANPAPLSVSERILKSSAHQLYQWLPANSKLGPWHFTLHVVEAAASGVFQPVHPGSSKLNLAISAPII